MAVQDLTPLSDAEAERINADQAQANARPANQPGDTVGIQGNKQEPKKSGGSEYVFTKEVEEVQLYATVVDQKNRIVTDLNQASFTVLEDGVQQQITSFSRQDVPVSLGILIDNSGSMRDKRSAVNQAALNLVRSSNPKDEVFIVNYSDEPYLDQDFTANISLLREALEKVEARGGTAIYDTVIASADHLVKGARQEKKVLFLVTDGEDNESRDTLEEAVRHVQDETGPTIYAIGILGDDRGKKRARRALERLAIETGGIAFFPKDISEVDAISKTVAHDIRSQYTIGYRPTRPQAMGGFRNVKVEARIGKDRLLVRTKSGYFAGQRKAQNQPPPSPNR